MASSSKRFSTLESSLQIFLRLNSKGVFEKLILDYQDHIESRLVGKDPSLLCIDSQSVDGDVNLDQKGIDGNKKVKGRKRHIVTDILGLIFLCLVTAANIADIHPAKEIVKELESQARLEKILVDSA